VHSKTATDNPRSFLFSPVECCAKRGYILHMVQKVLITSFVILALGVAWYLGSPLLFDKEVDEEFPLATITEEEHQEMADAVVELGITLPPIEDVKEMTPEELHELEVEIVENHLN